MGSATSIDSDITVDDFTQNMSSSSSSLEIEMEIDDDTKDTDASSITITSVKKRSVLRRYELWHHEFITYKEMLKYFFKLKKDYNSRLSIENLCYSNENRPICLLRIHSQNRKLNPMSVLIEGGANGSEKMAVSSLIYLVDILVKYRFKLMNEFLIIPCLNPDGYEKCLKLKRAAKNMDKIDLSKSFPKARSQMFEHEAPSTTCCCALNRALKKYKDNIKLFISLQANGDSLVYPLENYSTDTWNYAMACKKNMNKPNFNLHLIVPTLAEKYETSAEFVVKYYPDIKFSYIFNIHPKLLAPDQDLIIKKAEEVSVGIFTLVRRVYRNFCKNQVKNSYNVSTTVRKNDD